VENEEIGPRTRVWAWVHILPGAVVGADCNLCDRVFVEGTVRIGDGVIVKNGVCLWDGVELEDEVFVGPGVVFTNDPFPRAGSFKGTPDQFRPTRVRRGASVGANATIIAGVNIGSYALIAAGALVTKPVPPHALMVGAPARQRGWACCCGRPLPDDTPICSCGLEYREVGGSLKRSEEM